MEPHDQALTRLSELSEEQRRLLAVVQQLLDRMDARRRLECGEDGFDG